MPKVEILYIGTTCTNSVSGLVPFEVPRTWWVVRPPSKPVDLNQRVQGCKRGQVSEPLAIYLIYILHVYAYTCTYWISIYIHILHMYTYIYIYVIAYIYIYMRSACWLRLHHSIEIREKNRASRVSMCLFFIWQPSLGNAHGSAYWLVDILKKSTIFTKLHAPFSTAMIK